SLDEARAFATWRLTFGDHEVFALPRVVAFRTMALNHWYHHRGELVVYLRLLEVPVPVVYGRSADENPFASLVALRTPRRAAAARPRRSAAAPVVHGHGAVAKWRRRHQLELPDRGQPRREPRRPVAGNPRLHEEPVLVDQVEPVEGSGQRRAAQDRKSTRLNSSH